MEIFQTIQMNFALIGFERNLGPFNKRQRWCFSAGSLSAFMLIVYLLCVANTPKEYMDGIFVVAIGILMTISHISTMSKTENIFIFIDEAEEIINKSEFMFSPGGFITDTPIFQMTYGKNYFASRIQVSRIETIVRKNQPSNRAHE